MGGPVEVIRKRAQLLVTCQFLHSDGETRKIWQILGMGCSTPLTQNNHKLNLLLHLNEEKAKLKWLLFHQTDATWRLMLRLYFHNQILLFSFLSLILGRMRTPVREAFSYGIRHGIGHIHCDSMKHKVILHWITMNMPYPVPYPVWKCLPYGSTHPT